MSSAKHGLGSGIRAESLYVIFNFPNFSSVTIKWNMRKKCFTQGQCRGSSPWICIPSHFLNTLGYARDSEGVSWLGFPGWHTRRCQCGAWPCFCQCTLQALPLNASSNVKQGWWLLLLIKSEVQNTLRMLRAMHQTQKDPGNKIYSVSSLPSSLSIITVSPG